jgi:nucleotide-binding universal stress UspA family protein
VVVARASDERVERPTPTDRVLTRPAMENGVAAPGRDQAIVSSTANRDSERGIQAETTEAQGDPGAVIVEAAENADLVIVGTRGLNPIQRILLGSVSSKVVHRADCDVLVVR